MSSGLRLFYKEASAAQLIVIAHVPLNELYRYETRKRLKHAVLFLLLLAFVGYYIFYKIHVDKGLKNYEVPRHYRTRAVVHLSLHYQLFILCGNKCARGNLPLHRD
jgi:hypothetical protein